MITNTKVREEVPKRVLITVESVELFPETEKDPYAIDSSYRLIWRDVLESGLEEDGVHTYVVVKADLEEGLPDRHRIRLHSGAWVTPKEATDALVDRLVKELERCLKFESQDCTELIELVHGDTDFMCRDVGFLHANHTLGRVMATFEGRCMRIAGHLANTYSALLHQQCDLEHDKQRQEMGLTAQTNEK